MTEKELNTPTSVNQLINVSDTIINGETVNSVDARELHLFLESKQHFSDWVKIKIVESPFFQEEIDYILLHKSMMQNGSGGHNKKDYALTQDTAKKVSMSEQISRGNEARDYLIEIMNNVEKLLESLEIVNYSGGGSNLVFTKDGVPYTSSNIIAERFCKNHKDVMRSIDNHLAKNTDDLMVSDFNRRNFTPVEFLDKKNELRRAYELTEEGFSFTALGFTGERADKFKVEFIQAFFGIRDALQNRIKAEIARDLFPCITSKRNFVYILSNSDNGYLKIGVSNNVDKRISQLQTGSWAELSVEYRSMVCSNSFDIESTVHEKLRSKRVRGEWYDVSISDAISLIESEDHQLRTPLLKAYYEGCKAQMFKMDIKND